MQVFHRGLDVLVPLQILDGHQVYPIGGQPRTEGEAGQAYVFLYRNSGGQRGRFWTQVRPMVR